MTILDLPGVKYASAEDTVWCCASCASIYGKNLRPSTGVIYANPRTIPVDRSSESPPATMPTDAAREQAKADRAGVERRVRELYELARAQSVRPHGPSSLRDEWAMFAEGVARLRVPTVYPEPDE